MPSISITLCWLVALIAFLIAEGITAQLVSIWFALGSLAAMIAASMQAPLWLQLLLFFLVSALVLAATRPFVKHFTSRNVTPTNADRIIGQPCLVTEEIDEVAGTGAIKVKGQIWSARSRSGGCLSVGSHAQVVAIEGVKAIVVPAGTNQ